MGAISKDRPYAIFLSHAWADRRPPRSEERPERAGAEQLAAALKKRRVRVFFDDVEIDEFDSLSGRILDALAESRIVVTWGSDAYFTRRACAAELTYAMVGALTSDVQRVLVVNPEKEVSHLPAVLREQLVAAAPSPDDPQAMAELAKMVIKRLRATSQPLGEVADAHATQWHPETVPSASRFVGRFHELWELHGQLTGTALAGNHASHEVVVVDGMAGSGKTVLVLEYAHRFAAAWPGGIVWLRAHGFDTDSHVSAAASKRRARSEFAALATHLELPRSAGLGLAELRRRVAAMFAGSGPVLWVVDDLPATGRLEDWQAPMPQGRTILTTRVQQFQNVAGSLHLDQLAPADAYTLLTHGFPPATDSEITAAHTIVERLGFHALALDITRRRVSGPSDYSPMLELLERDVVKVLASSAKTAAMLPGEHTPYIEATFGSSLRSLSDAGRDILQIATALPSVPIPDDVLHDIVAARTGPETLDTTLRAADGVADLVNQSLARRGDRTLHVHRLTLDLARAQYPLADLTTVTDAAHSSLSSALAKADDLGARRALRPHYELAVAMRPPRGRSDLPLLIGAYEVAIGDTASSIKRLEAEVGRRLTDPDLGSGDPRTIASKNSLGAAYLSAGRVDAARELFSSNLELMLRLFSRQHPDTITCINNLARAHTAAGDDATAQELLKNTLRDCERLLGPLDPGTILSRDNLASSYLFTKDFARALKLFSVNLASFETGYGTDDPRTLAARVKVANALLAKGDPDAALSLLEPTVAAMTGRLGADDLNTLAACGRLGVARARIGDLGAAIESLGDVLHRTEDALGASSPRTLSCVVDLAQAYEASDRQTEALDLYTRAQDGFRRMYGPKHPDTRTADAAVKRLVALFRAQKK